MGMMQYPQNQHSNYDMNANYYRASRNQDRPEGDSFPYKTYFGSSDKKFSDDLNYCEQGSTLSRSSGDNLSSKEMKFKNHFYRMWDSSNVSEDEKKEIEQDVNNVEQYLKAGNNGFSQKVDYEDDKTLQKAF